MSEWPALESTRTIEIDEFVDKADIDPRYLIRPYYLRPDGKVGHDAFAVIRETIREMDKVAIGRVVLTSREHIIALEPMDKGLVGTLLRYPYEVRSEQEYFGEIQDVKVTKDMLDLAKHIVNQKAGRFEPGKFEDQYETALVDLINQKRAGKPITPKERPRAENVVDLMDALRKSVNGAAAETKAPKKPGKKTKKAAAGQKEMLMPIAGRSRRRKRRLKRPLPSHNGSPPEPAGESCMDMKEASAMTEASGLVNETDGVERPSAGRRDASAEAGMSPRPLQSASQEAAMRWAKRVREATVKAPLQSLFVAFLLGIWVARRS